MGLLQKLYHSFKNRANAKKSELGPEGIKYLKKLASKFGTAIEKRAGGVKLSSLGEDEKEEEKQKADEASNEAKNEGVSDERASLTPTKAENLKLVLIQLGKKRIVKNAGGKKITILTDEFTANKAIFSSKGRSKNEVNARIKAIPKFEKIIRDSEYVESDTVITGIEKSAKKGVIAMHKFKGTYENYDIEILVRDKGKRQFLYEIKFKENKKSPQQSMTDKSASTAPSGDVENDTRISQKSQNVNSSDERKSKIRSYDPKNGENNVFDIEEVAEQLSQEDAQQGRGLVEFVNAVEQMTDKSLISKRKHRIGRISVEHAEFAQTLLEEIGIDIDLSNFELWIDGTGAQHIEIRHGKEGKADSTMVEDELKAKIPWAVNNADSGEIMRNDNGEIEYSNRFFNADGSKAPQIKLYKKIGEDTLCVSECVPDCKFRRVYITSSYIKKGSKGQLLNMEEQSSPQPTPEASFDSNATNDIIHDNSEKNNSFDERKSKTSSNNSKTDSETDYFEEYMKEFNENLKANHENRKLKAENSRLRRFIANNVNQKVYSVSHSKEAISDILNGAYFGGYDVKIQGSKLKGIEKELYDALNFTEKNRGAKALDMREVITALNKMGLNIS